MGYYANHSLFAGMDTATLQAALTSAQTALIALQIGAQTASVSIGSGPVTRNLVYRATNTAGLAALIQELQRQLGIVKHPRRMIRIM
jgi:hypothetical protein